MKLKISDSKGRFCSWN